MEFAVDISSKDTGMKSEISKCVKVIVHRGKFKSVEGIPTCTCRITDQRVQVPRCSANKPEYANKVEDEMKQTYIKRITQTLMSNNEA